MKSVNKSVTIHRPALELYTFWRNFENLPHFMNNVESVQVEAGGWRSHWKVSAPAGTSVEWDAEIIDDQPGHHISWQSLEHADVKNSGIVYFEPLDDGRSTVVRVEMQYDPPAGALGVAIAKLFGEEPEIQVEEDLQRFKHLMETGQFTPEMSRNMAGSTLASGQQTVQSRSDSGDTITDDEQSNIPVGTRNPAVGSVLASVGTVFAAVGSVIAG